MKVLVVGNGGREHTLAWKLSQSPDVSKVFVAPGNAGTAVDAENVAIPATDLPALLKFAQKEKIDLTVAGPEAPLVAGIVDLFESAGLKIFGPSNSVTIIRGAVTTLMKKPGSVQFMSACQLPMPPAMRRIR